MLAPRHEAVGTPIPSLGAWRLVGLARGEPETWRTAIKAVSRCGERLDSCLRRNDGRGWYWSQVAGWAGDGQTRQAAARWGERLDSGLRRNDGRGGGSSAKRPRNDDSGFLTQRHRQHHCDANTNDRGS